MNAVQALSLSDRIFASARTVALCADQLAAAGASLTEDPVGHELVLIAEELRRLRHRMDRYAEGKRL